MSRILWWKPSPNHLQLSRASRGILLPHLGWMLSDQEYQCWHWLAYNISSSWANQRWLGLSHRFRLSSWSKRIAWWRNSWTSLSIDVLALGKTVSRHRAYALSILRPDTHCIFWHRTQHRFWTLANNIFRLSTLEFSRFQNGLPMDCHDTC